MFTVTLYDIINFRGPCFVHISIVYNDLISSHIGAIRLYTLYMSMLLTIVIVYSDPYFSFLLCKDRVCVGNAKRRRVMAL